MADRMLPSTNGDLYWSINCYKSHSRKGVVIVSATEGVREVHDGYETFTATIDFAGGANGGSRVVRDVLPCARLTEKKKRELLNDLIERMNDAGLIKTEPDDD